LMRNRLNVSFPGCLPGDSTSGIDLIKMLVERYKSVSGFHTAYWEGVSIAAIMARALQRAHETLGKIDGPTVNLALETFENEDFGGLIPNITYTATNHSASFVTRIVRVNENQTFTPLTKFLMPAENPFIPLAGLMHQTIPFKLSPLSNSPQTPGT